jgi:hypothetical protein
MDETGINRSDPYCTIAGYVADVDQWDNSIMTGGMCLASICAKYRKRSGISTLTSSTTVKGSLPAGDQASGSRGGIDPLCGYARHSTPSQQNGTNNLCDPHIADKAPVLHNKRKLAVTTLRPAAQRPLDSLTWTTHVGGSPGGVVKPFAEA